MDTSVETLIAACVAERDALREQVTSLQQRGTELVEENRRLKTLTGYLKAQKEQLAKLELHSVPIHVRHFMEATSVYEASTYEDGEPAMPVPLPTVPHIPDEATLRLRLKLVAEEFFEMLDACNVVATGDHEDAWPIVRYAIENDEVAINLPELADALADIMYVCEGFYLACGIDSGPVAAEVHRSNMTKLPFAKDASGKVQKGPNYSPPDIAGELRKQGWVG